LHHLSFALTHDSIVQSWVCQVRAPACGYVGGGGLGDFAIVYGYRAFEWEVTVVATLIIIVLVQAAQFFGNWLSSKVMRR